MWTSQLIFSILLSARHAQQSASEGIYPHLKVTEGNERAHEWSKHGTCSTDLPATADQLKYFTTGIMLNRQFDISRILADAGIISSLQQHIRLFEDFMDAVTKSVGFPPDLECEVATMKNGSKLHMISQIEICLDKEFKPRTCYSKVEQGDNSSDNRIMVETTQKEQDKDTLYFKRHSKKRSHSHAGPQSDCPRKYEFYYPPMHYQ